MHAPGVRHEVVEDAKLWSPPAGRQSLRGPMLRWRLKSRQHILVGTALYGAVCYRARWGAPVLS